ncbi:hypothetical protein CMI37_24795 [Candidatus Pacearchaeota archaeon]|nr:hypothetical protein [Candidatus Pacearchaeota archaeon]
MLKIENNLNEKEIKSLIELLADFTAVEEIIIDDVEIRVRGRKGHSGGLHGSAVYRTNDIRTIYSHAHAKCVEAEKAVNEIRNRATLESDSAGEHSKNEGSKGTKVLTYEESMER